MKELKLKPGDVKAFERQLEDLGAQAGPEHWIGNWYLETTPCRVRKIVRQNEIYRLLELEKLDQGFVFTKNEIINDIAPLRLEETAPHNILHKTVRPWTIGKLGVDILLFDDIPPYACVNYEDPHKNEALDFIRNGLGITRPEFLEIPFNVLKRRALGVPDFDGPAYEALAIKNL